MGAIITLPWLVFYMSLKKYFLQQLPVFGVSLYKLENNYVFIVCKRMQIVIVLCYQFIFFLLIMLNLNFLFIDLSRWKK